MGDAFFISYLVLWFLVLLLTCVVAALARQVGVLHVRLGPMGAAMKDAGPEIGTQAPEIEVLDLKGEPRRLGGLRDKDTLLVFFSPSCPACVDVASSVVSIAKSERAYIDVLLVSVIEDVPACIRFQRKYKLDSLPCVVSNKVALAYRVLSAPFAILVNDKGVVVTKGVVNNGEHLQSLLNAAELGHPTMESYLGSADSTLAKDQVNG